MKIVKTYLVSEIVDKQKDNKDNNMHYINLRIKGNLIPRAQIKAYSLGISVSDYVKQLIQKDLNDNDINL